MATNNQFGLPFVPVRTTQEKLDSGQCAIYNGYTYFTTDTKKIYVGMPDGSIIPMGGNSGIYYGTRVLTDDELNSDLSELFFSSETDIDGDQTPNVNDLILNVPDGGFYRVTNVMGDSVTGLKIAMSGGGGAVGPAGGGKPKVVLEQISTVYIQATDYDQMVIRYKCRNTSGDKLNYIQRVQYKIGNSNTIVSDDSKRYYFDETTNLTVDTITFDLRKYFEAGTYFKQGDNSITIQVEDAYGSLSNYAYFNFNLVELILEDSMSRFAIKYLNNDDTTYTYTYKPKADKELDNLQIILKLYNELREECGSWQSEPANLNNNNKITINFDKDLQHGAYTLEAQLSDRIPTTGQQIFSNIQKIYFGMWNSEAPEPIIVSDFENYEEIMRYVPYNLNFMIVDKAESASDKVALSIQSIATEETLTLPEQSLIVNEETSFEYSFNSIGTQQLSIIYKGISTTLGLIEVIEYEGDAPVLKPEEADFYLRAAGHSNAEINRNIWTSIGKEQNTNINHAELIDMLWSENNGWVKDSDNETALKLTNGSKLVAKFPVLRSQAENDGSLSGLTIELDFKLENVSNFAQPLIQCLSYNNENKIHSGFHITGQKATLNTTTVQATTASLEGEEDAEGNVSAVDMSLQAYTQYYGEGERIHLTYIIPAVPALKNIKDNDYYFVTTYVNGVISGIAKLAIDKTAQSIEQFVDYTATAPALFTCDSTYGDIYLYNFRVTRNECNNQEAIRRYIASYENMNKRVELWATNNIYDSANKINLSAIQALSNGIGVPYVLFQGGNSIGKKFSDNFEFNPTQTDLYQLPNSKSDYRLFAMQLYNPGRKEATIDVPIEVQDGNGKIYTNFNDIPEGTYTVKRGVQLYGQGTSSMAYPVKNLRAKFAQENDYFVVYNGAFPVEIICFKADYMDSSSTHNTQTGNLIYELYSNLGMRTPPQEFAKKYPELYGGDITTAIKGYPVICFYTEGNDNIYEYIGRYNLNLDKATPEPFGFKPQIVRNEQGEIIDSIGYKEDENDKLVDIVQCWEFLNNDAQTPVKFLSENSYKNNFADNMKYKWNKYFEDRYPDEISSWQKDNPDKLAADDATWGPFLSNGLFRLTEWVNSTATTEATNNEFEEPIYYKTTDIKYDIKKKYYKKLYDNEYELVDNIQPTNMVSVQATNSEGKVLEVGITINKEKFVSSDEINGEDTYYFSYDEDTEQWLAFEKSYSQEDLDSYFGITYNTGTNWPEGAEIVVDYSIVYEGWNSALYEQYTIDNAKYRLAKFKDEFEQYFNKQFCLFYYILTLLLLMMDSRAKNMMLASWDETIWYPIFYDMDTMLGVNNTGFNKFSFDTEDAEEDRVFNGYDSVLWNNFKICFASDIAIFYNRMRDVGKLTLAKLLSYYNNNGAESWNEALTSADAIFKYERPFGEGYYDNSKDEPIWVKPGEKNYLYAAQGKRSNHRTWWLSNRLNYFDSEYLPLSLGDQKPVASDTFSFRAYSLPEQKKTEAAENCVSVIPASHQFNLTPLNNCYLSLMIGNNIYGPIYAISGETVENIGPDNVRHEVESYILNPTLLSDIGDLSNKYLGSWNFPAKPTKLTKLKFGQTKRSHPDTYQVYYNKLLTSLNIGSTCPLLQEINIGQYKLLRELDLTQCRNLNKIDAHGCSNLATISLPMQSVLQYLYLPSSITSLGLVGQPHLEIIEFDNDYPNLSALRIEDVKYNTYDLVLNTIAKNQQINYTLKNIQWIIDQEEQVGLVDEYINKINILEELKKTENHSSISGTIILNIANVKVNEFNLYDKYRKDYPLITFAFGDNMSGQVISAHRITFYEEDKTTIFYQVLGNGNAPIVLGDLIENLGTPIKNPTVEFEYEFEGWQNQLDNKIYTKVELQNYEVNSSINFVAKFIQKTAIKKVSFYTERGQSLIKTFSIEYNQPYQGEIQNYYTSPNRTDLSEHERYAFKGWSKNPNNKQIINWEELQHIKTDLNLYAYYEKENCLTTSSNLWYFNITGENNEIINIAEEYRQILEGKITIPKGYEVIGDFAAMINITDMYFEEGNQYKFVQDYAFNIGMIKGTDREVVEENIIHNMQLKHIYLPNTIEIIGKFAFSGLYSLEYLDLQHQGKMPSQLKQILYGAFSNSSSWNSIYQMKLFVNELPQGLERIEDRAFRFGGNNIKITSLPYNITTLATNCFSSCGNVAILQFGSNHQTEFTFKILCLSYTGRNYPEKNNITLIFNQNVKATSFPDPNEDTIFANYLSISQPYIVPFIKIIWNCSINTTENQKEEFENMVLQHLGSSYSVAMGNVSFEINEVAS